MNYNIFYRATLRDNEKL